MKKTWFDARLYGEALRQLRVIGIVNLVLCTVFDLLGVVMEFLDELMWSAMDIPTEVPAFTDYSPLGFLQNHLWLIVCLLVFAPLYALYLFRFLTRRRQSDFYHGLPQTRSCLFISFSAAILTWLLSAVLVSSALVYGLQAILTPDSVAPIGIAAMTVLNIAAGCLLVTAASLLAASLSGTVLTSLIALALILFVPRVLISVIGGALTNTVGVIQTEQLGFMFRNVNVVTSIFDVDMYTDLWAALYTFVLAAIYFLLAFWAFGRRPSEAAGQSAVSRGMQTVYRLTVSFLFCLPAILILYSLFVNTGTPVYWEGETYAGVDKVYALFSIVWWYVGALVAYFLFELLTTRKARNLMRSLPWLGVLAGLNVACVLAMTFGTQGIWSYQPAVDEVDSVSMVNILDYSDTGFYYDDYYSYGGYFGYPEIDNDAEMLNDGYKAFGYDKVILTDTTSKKIVCSALKRRIANARGGYPDIIEYNSVSSKTYKVEVAMCSGGLIRYRVVVLNNTEYINLKKAIREQQG